MARARIALALGIALLLACHGERPPEPTAKGPSESLLIRGARLPGGNAIDVLIRAGHIAALGASLPRAAGVPILEAQGRYLVPAAIDSHVHLSYRAEGERLAERGVAAAVDLAAPLPLPNPIPGLERLSSGPMLTARAGYPTRSWGRDGYGVEVESEAQLLAALDANQAAGARLLKLSLGAGPDLPRALLELSVREAHARGLLVAVHALDDSAAALAADIGADLLAHTPLEALRPETIEAWSSRAFVSTLSAFGNRPGARQNLKALHEAGATLLYGTDFGNTREAGISCSEIDALQGAGLSHRAILEALTIAPARFFGFANLGRLELGARARLLLLDEDPLQESLSLCRPSQVL